MFAWKVECNVCGATNVTGSLSSPATGWTKEQILANAIHNPGCRIVKFSLPESDIATSEDDSDPSEVAYSISLV